METNNEITSDSSYENANVSEQSTANSWIPPELIGTVLERFNSSDEVLKSYVNLYAMQSKRREDFSQNEREAFLNMRQETFDIPVDISGYDIDTSPIREGSQNNLSDEEIYSVKNMAMALGLNTNQAQAQYDMLNDIVSVAQENNAVQMEQVSCQNGYDLAQMWGESNIDSCIADVDTGMSVAAKITGIEESKLRDELEPIMCGSCPPSLIEVFRVFSQLGGQGYGHGMSSGRTPFDAQNQLDMLRNSEDFKKAIRMGSGTPEYRNMMSMTEALTRQIHGE